MLNLLNFLQSVHPMSDALKSHLLSVLKFKELAKKDYLLKAGHISKHVCFISKGLLRCFYLRGDTEVSSWFMKEGDVIFSISSYYEQKPSYESIQALEDCELYYISFEESEYMFKMFPEFCYIGLQLTRKYHLLWDKQLYSLRMQNAHERYQWLLINYPELLLRVPAKHIASYLDITEVTLSKIKGKK